MSDIGFFSFLVPLAKNIIYLHNRPAECGLEQRVLPQQQWCGRRVRVCDGTTVLMSDSVANQAEYPQHGNQTEGCGFPIAKLVVIFKAHDGCGGSGLYRALGNQ